MHKIVVTTILSGVLAVAHAQGTGAIQRSSSPQGVQIQGDTMINANVQNTQATAVGEGNTAKTATGAVKGGTQIQGNTKINATAKNVNAIAVGKGNAATNDVGAIGGK